MQRVAGIETKLAVLMWTVGTLVPLNIALTAGALWVVLGAGDETFLHSFQGRVFNTAHHTGQTPSEVVKRMIRGEQPLLSGGPGMAPALPRGQAPTKAQTSTVEAGGSPPPPSDQAEPGHPFY